MIIITGPSRSGICMTARVFSLAGVPGGSLNWQLDNLEVFELLGPVFRDAGLDLYGIDPIRNPPVPLDLPRESLLAIFSGDKEFFVKINAACLSWKSFVETFPEATWILVRRNRKDVIHSCLNTEYMNSYYTYSQWNWWLSKYECSYVQIKERVPNVHEVSPSRFFDGDFGEVKSIFQELGIKWDDSIPANFKRPKHE